MKKKPGTEAPTFNFSPELFEQRALAMERLAEAGVLWMSDYASVDLMHPEVGLEICGVRSETNIRPILRIMRQLFPEWRFGDCWFKAEGADIGWCIAVHKYPSRYCRGF